MQEFALDAATGALTLTRSAGCVAKAAAALGVDAAALLATYVHNTCTHSLSSRTHTTHTRAAALQPS